MNRRDDTNTGDAAARAVERVLRAERDADAALEAARAQGQALQAAARDEALAIVNRALERAARWQRVHAAALQQRLDERRAAAERGVRPPPDAAALQAAVALVAAQLTGAGDDDPR